MKALILCAGEGTRLMPLTKDCPKPMVRINNKPILEYNIKLCKKYGIKDIAINTFYLPKKIKEYFGDGLKFGVRLKYSHESELLGTSGALNNFIDFFDESFVVICGDNITDINLKKMIDYHKSKKGIATLALRRKTTDLTSGGFVLTNKASQIKEFYEKSIMEEEKELDLKSFWKNSGIYVLEPSIMKYIPTGYSDFGKDIFPKLIKKGKKLFNYDISASYFCDVGKIEKYEKAKKDIESGLVKLNFDKNKAIFLDRDGVVNEIIYEIDGRIMSPATIEQLKIIKGVKESIHKLKEIGFKIIVITNQPGIALGYLSKEKLEQINGFLKRDLGIDEIYSCPHHPKITGKCDCRKPKIGLIKKAEKDFNIDIKNSYFVGDSLSDIQTGKTAKVKRTFRIGSVRLDILELQHKKDIFPSFTYPNLINVAKKINEIELA